MVGSYTILNAIMANVNSANNIDRMVINLLPLHALWLRLVWFVDDEDNDDGITCGSISISNGANQSATNAGQLVTNSLQLITPLLDTMTETYTMRQL